MEFSIRYVVDYRRRRTTKDEWFSRVLDEMEASDGRVSLASATFELVDAPPMRVPLSAAHSTRSSHGQSIGARCGIPEMLDGRATD